MPGTISASPSPRRFLPNITLVRTRTRLHTINWRAKNSTTAMAARCLAAMAAATTRRRRCRASCCGTALYAMRVWVCVGRASWRQIWHRLVHLVGDRFVRNWFLGFARFIRKARVINLRVQYVCVFVAHSSLQYILSCCFVEYFRLYLY